MVVNGIFPLNHLESMEEGQKYTGIEHQSILVFLYFPHFICCQCVSVFLSNAAQTHNFLFINH